MEAVQNQPDILLILTDQWNPRMVGYAGDAVVRTPHLDALAREGIQFEAAYTQSPVCMPARCSLASGLYPHNHGFWSNFTGRKFPAEQITLFRDLRAAGYTTAKIGKYHYFNLEWGESYDDHRDYYGRLGLDRPQELPTPYMGPYLKNQYIDYLKQKGLLETYIADTAYRFEHGDFDVVRPSPLSPDDHIDGYVAQQALEYIDQYSRQDPMFLCVSFPGPHTPFDAPGEYAERFDAGDIELAPNVPETVRNFDREHIRRAQANYYGKLAHLDDRIGQLVAALKRRGRWENTLLIFAADHGEYLGSHGRMAKGGFEEESARIPLMMRWPKRIPSGQVCRTPVEWIDIYATVVDAAGGEQSPHRFGASLLPLATGEQDIAHEAVFSEIGRGNHLNYMVRTARYKWFVQNGRESLYDLEEDAYELHDLINEQDDNQDYRSIVASMKERLLTFLMRTQVNRSADYQPLFTRIGIRADSSEGTAPSITEMLRNVHSL